MTDEKILKKVGKLLKLYGVSDEEKDKFILDLQDKKYDDQEDLEDEPQVNEEIEEESTDEVEEQPVEEPNEELEGQPVEEETEEVEESQLPVDEPVDQPVPEQPLEQEQVEEPQQEFPVEQPQETVEDERFEEIKKTNEGLEARLKALEDLVSKLAIPEDTDIGLQGSNETASVSQNSFDDFNRRRMGR